MLRRATLAVLCWTSDRCFTMWLSAFLLTLLLSLGESGPAGRIVKGIEAQPHSWPSQLSLRLGDSHICGAVVLNENFALTAAHCIDIVGTAAQNFSVVCGAHDLRDPDSNWQVSEAETLIKHEAYDANGYGFPDDIGLIRLSTPLVMNEVCQPATLPPDDSNDYANTESYITGWGRIGGNDRAANVLKQASINTLTNRKCSEFWWLFSPVRGTHICVHDNTLTHGACNGDSGGPLFSPENTLGDMTVTGLTSFGMANCDTRYPSVYTRVSKYLDWIRSNAQ